MHRVARFVTLTSLIAALAASALSPAAASTPAPFRHGLAGMSLLAAPCASGGLVDLAGSGADHVFGPGPASGRNGNGSLRLFSQPGQQVLLARHVTSLAAVTGWWISVLSPGGRPVVAQVRIDTADGVRTLTTSVPSTAGRWQSHHLEGESYQLRDETGAPVGDSTTWGDYLARYGDAPAELLVGPDSCAPVTGDPATPAIELYLDSYAVEVPGQYMQLDFEGQPLPTHVDIDRSCASVRVGRSLRVTGRVTAEGQALAGATTWLWTRSTSADPWRHIATRVSDEHGRVGVSTTPHRDTWYRWTYRPDGRHRAATSSTVRVTVNR